MRYKTGDVTIIGTVINDSVKPVSEIDQITKSHWDVLFPGWEKHTIAHIMFKEPKRVLTEDMARLLIDRGVIQSYDNFGYFLLDVAIPNDSSYFHWYIND